jgi:hypothetical protein
MKCLGKGRPVIDEFEFFLEKECSDGLSVVTPTAERVQRMLTGTRWHADDVLGHIPPLIAAGGWGPCTAICHGLSGGSRAVHGAYEV